MRNIRCIYNQLGLPVIRSSGWADVLGSMKLDYARLIRIENVFVYHVTPD